MEFTAMESIKLLTLAFFKMSWLWLPSTIGGLILRKYFNQMLEDVVVEDKVRIQFDEYTENQKVA